MKYYNTIYLCIHKRLHDKAGLSGIIHKDNLDRLLREIYHIPKPLVSVVIKELKIYGMIDYTCLKRNPIIIVKPILINPSENLYEIYNNVGLFT